MGSSDIDLYGTVRKFQHERLIASGNIVRGVESLQAAPGSAFVIGCADGDMERIDSLVFIGDLGIFDSFIHSINYTSRMMWIAGIELCKFRIVHPV